MAIRNPEINLKLRTLHDYHAIYLDGELGQNLARCGFQITKPALSGQAHAITRCKYLRILIPDWRDNTALIEPLSSLIKPTEQVGRSLCTEAKQVAAPGMRDDKAVMDDPNPTTQLQERNEEQQSPSEGSTTAQFVANTVRQTAASKIDCPHCHKLIEITLMSTMIAKGASNGNKVASALGNDPAPNPSPGTLHSSIEEQASNLIIDEYDKPLFDLIDLHFEQLPCIPALKPDSTSTSDLTISTSADEYASFATAVEGPMSPPQEPQVSAPIPDSNGRLEENSLITLTQASADVIDDRTDLINNLDDSTPNQSPDKVATAALPTATDDISPRPRQLRYSNNGTKKVPFRRVASTNVTMKSRSAVPQQHVSTADMTYTSKQNEQQPPLPSTSRSASAPHLLNNNQTINKRMELPNPSLNTMVDLGNHEQNDNHLPVSPAPQPHPRTKRWPRVHSPQPQPQTQPEPPTTTGHLSEQHLNTSAAGFKDDTRPLRKAGNVAMTAVRSLTRGVTASQWAS